MAQPNLGEYSSGPWYLVWVPKSLYPSLDLFFFFGQKLKSDILCIRAFISTALDPSGRIRLSV